MMALIAALGVPAALVIALAREATRPGAARPNAGIKSPVYIYRPLPLPRLLEQPTDDPPLGPDDFPALNDFDGRDDYYAPAPAGEF